MPTGLLATHHVRRPRLVEAVLTASVAVVEAGGGYGKTSLAMEIAEQLPSALVVPLPPGCRPRDLCTAVARTARLRGEEELSDRLQSASTADPADALIAAFGLTPGGRTLLVDDLEHADADTAATLLTIARSLSPPHRLVLIGRSVPPAAGGLLRLPHICHLTADDLALRTEEVAALARDGFGLSLEDDEVTQLRQGTSGWAAAAVMMCSRAGRTTTDIDVGIADVTSVLEVLVERLRSNLTDHERWLAAQLAYLPRFDDALVAGLMDAEVFHRLTAAGLALTTVGPGWRRLVGPLTEQLRTWAPLDAKTANTAAERFVDANSPVDAVHLLVTAGSVDRAVEVLRTAAEAGDLDAADVLSVTTIFGTFLTDRPVLWLLRARAFLDLWWWQARREALERAERLLRDQPDPALELAVAAERAIDLVVAKARAADAVATAEQILASEQLDLVTRLRALEALGRGLAFEPSPAAQQRAREVLEEAMVLAERLGPDRRRVRTAIVYAKMVLFPAGDARRLLAAYDAVLPRTRPETRLRAELQVYRSEALLDLADEVALGEAVAEAERIGNRLDDRRILAHVAWLRAMLACQKGDEVTTLDRLREAESLMPDLDGKIGLLLFRDAAEECLKLGRGDLARRYLRRLDHVDGADGEGEGYLRQARAFHEALHGDAAAAVATLEALDRTHPNPRESWRRALHRAAALERLGDVRAATEAATAFDIANRLGGPGLAAWREPRLTAALHPLVRSAPVGTGHGGEVTATAPTPRVSIRALGGFAVEIDGHDRTPPEGRPAALLQVLVAARGRITGDTMIDALWPDSSPTRGRQSLRNALHRLPMRELMVERDGGKLTLAAGVSVDAIDLWRAIEDAATDLRTDPEVGVTAACRTIGAYPGQLLPTSSMPFVEEMRDDLHLRLAALWTDAARIAAQMDRIDDAESLLRAALRMDPDREGRWLRLFDLLLGHGRVADAERALDELTARLSTLGLEADPAVRRAEQRLQQAAQS